MLYFLKTLDYYKVGFTENLNSRMKAYASDNPIAELLGIKDGTKQDEKRYQISFCNYEGTGEWYKLPESVVKEIQKDFIPSDALIHHKKKFRTESEEYRKNYEEKRDRREYYKERAKRPERKGYMNEYLKKYRESLTEEQKDKYKEYQRKYREEHREELRQKQKERREKNKAAS